MDDLFDRETSHNKYTLSSFQANIIGPGGTEQKLHIDNAFPEPLPAYNTAGKNLMQANTVWVLDDYTQDNGATWYLPGSHKFGCKPRPADQSRSDLIQLSGVKRGSLAIHNGLLWHKSGENRTANDRIVLLGSFAASFFRDISNEEEYLKVLDDDVIEQSSVKLRELVGIGHGVHRGALQPPLEWDE